MEQLALENKPKLGILLFPFVIALVILHDFLFLNMEYLYGSTFGLNLWKEVIAGGYLFVVSLKMIVRGSVSKVKVRLILFSLFLLIFLLFGGVFNEAAFRSLRALFTPFVLAVMVAQFVSGNYQKRYRLFVISLQCTGFAVAIYGLYQLLYYSKWADFWYVEPLTSMGFELKEFNAIRDGRPRISSFFTSSLEFAFFIVFIFFLNYGRLLFMSRNASYAVMLGKFFFLILLVFLLFNSTVRSAQICWLAGMVFSAFIIFIKTRLFRYCSGLSLMIFLCLSTFFYIGMGYTDDLSAIGRLVQWHFVFDQLRATPFGLGFSVIGPGQLYWFDSLWLNMLAIFGFMSIIVFGVFLYWYKLLAYGYSEVEMYRRPALQSLCYTMLILCPVFMYAAFFQAFYNSTVFYIYLIMMFCAIFEVKNVHS